MNDIEYAAWLEHERYWSELAEVHRRNLGGVIDWYHASADLAELRVMKGAAWVIEFVEGGSVGAVNG